LPEEKNMTMQPEKRPALLAQLKETVVETEESLAELKEYLAQYDSAKDESERQEIDASIFYLCLGDAVEELVCAYREFFLASMGLHEATLAHDRLERRAKAREMNNEKHEPPVAALSVAVADIQKSLKELKKCLLRYDRAKDEEEQQDIDADIRYLWVDFLELEVDKLTEASRAFTAAENDAFFGEPERTSMERKRIA
jgi:hypothetical protein